MKAIQITKTGGPEALELVDLPRPEPGPGEVVIRAHAIGVGKPDVLFRTGVYRWMPPLPAIPGAEMTGYVETLGAGVSDLQIGEPVLVYHLGGGCYAQYAKVPASAVTRLPPGIDLDDAVSIPNYQVACALLTEAARGIAAKTVYVNGAAGGIGSAVIQLCRLQNITVIAGASTAAKCAFAQSQGATHTIDYGRESVAERLLDLTARAWCRSHPRSHRRQGFHRQSQGARAFRPDRLVQRAGRLAGERSFPRDARASAEEPGRALLHHAQFRS